MSNRSTSPLMIVLALLVIFGLSLQIWTLFELSRARSTARQELNAVSQQLAILRNETFSLNVPINESIPIDTIVPVRQSLNVPISTTLFIDTFVTIPIDTPFGATTFDVPIRGNFPIRTNVPFDIETDVEVSTTVDLRLNVPINLPISETPFARLLEDLEQRLLILQESL